METNKLQKLLGRTLFFTSGWGSSAGAFGEPKKRKPKSLSLALVSMVAFSGVAFADVKMPQVFGEHMVLQEGAALVWGEATPGEKITVTYAGATANGTAGKEGEWKIELKGLKSSDVGKPLKISGNNTIQFEDVIVGDVWVAAGQSNMEIWL